MNTFLQDIRFGLRSLLARPGFTVLAVLAVGLGIGATTAIYSVIDVVLRQPLPYPEPERLLTLWQYADVDESPEGLTSYPNFIDWRERQTSFEDVVAYRLSPVNLTSEGEPERLRGCAASAEIFSLLGVEAARGRTFHADEAEEGRDGVVVLSHDFWQRRFAGDPALLGRDVELDGRSRQIIGILPASFTFPRGVKNFTEPIDLWFPLAPVQVFREARAADWLWVLGRLEPGVTAAAAAAEMATIVEQLEAEYPDFNSGTNSYVVSLAEHMVGKVRGALLLLFGAVLLVLLIASANVANLLLAHSAARDREIGVRTAMGATRLRLVRQMLTESVLLALPGGLLGVLFAWWGLRLLVALEPAGIPRLDEVGLDGPVLLFSLAVTLVTGLLFGMVPAFTAPEVDLQESLKESSRGSSGGRRGRRLRSSLVVAEIALSLVLLAGAGLLIRSLGQLRAVDPGFDPESTLAMEIHLPGFLYPQPAEATRFYQDLLERLRALPGVTAAGATSNVLKSEFPFTFTFEIEGRPAPPPEQQEFVSVDFVSDGYFRAMDIPLVAGRDFGPEDQFESEPVIIINQAMARRWWPGEDAVGKRVQFATQVTSWRRIVGVVGDVHRDGLDRAVDPETFVPHRQFPSRSMTLVVRGEGDALALAGPVRQALWSLDGRVPVSRISTLEEMLGEQLAQRRFYMWLLGLFAIVAVALAAVGIYGVMSYVVAQSTRELGIRMALGARRARVLAMVIGRSLALAVAGVAIGVGLSLLLGRLLTEVLGGLLFEVSPSDPRTYGMVGLGLLAVVLLASLMPARRATRVDPVVALRYE